MMRLPLGQWTLHMEHLPERLKEKSASRGFSLPGAEALGAFADLIGGDDAQAPAEDSGVHYAPAGPFESDMPGEITLSTQIDFGALRGDRAVLTFEHLAGRGEILLGGQEIARFDGRQNQADVLLDAFENTGMPCRLCVDVTDALMLGGSGRLEIRFDAARPAGVCGAVFLRISRGAYLSRVSIQGDARRKTMTMRAHANTLHEGEYALRVQLIEPAPGAALLPAREMGFSLAAGEEKGIVLSMEAKAGRFVSGQAYDAPAIRIQLFLIDRARKGRELLCDDALLLCGYGADAPKAFLPLEDADCAGDAGALCGHLAALHVPAVLISSPAPDGLYRALCRAGIACVQHVSEALRPAFTRYPCLSLLDRPAEAAAPSLEAAAWQMTGSVSFPRALDASLSPDEMLFEACGRRLNREDKHVHAALAWLRCVQIRLRCEAARQGRWQGPLCSAQEAKSADIEDAIRTAFAPVHLSALPLSGAWWTGTQFSASLEAFLPENHGGKIRALAVLEDEEGCEIARFDTLCAKNGYIGVIEAQLPEKACVLTLTCRLTKDGEVLEESSLPVYVGEMGPLEAAF